MNHVFPKLAVYNSVDPSLAPSLLMVSSLCDIDNLSHKKSYQKAR